MEQFKIVPAVSDEQVQLIASLAHTIWNQHFTPIIGQEQVDYMLEKFQSFSAVKKQISDNYQYYLICSDGQPAGYSGIKIENNALFLSKLYLLPEYRGKKLASRTMAYYESLCHEQNLQKIWLTCNKDNAGSISAYKAMDFEITRTQVADIGNGYVMDDFILEKPIALR